MLSVSQSVLITSSDGQIDLSISLAIQSYLLAKQFLGSKNILILGQKFERLYVVGFQPYC